MTAAIWCRDHAPKTRVHYVHDMVEGTNLNALQFYVQNYKQADLTLTGTVRKATHVNQSTKVATPAATGPVVTRRAANRTSISHVKVEEPVALAGAEDGKKICTTCEIDVSPKWWPKFVRVVEAEPSPPKDEDLDHSMAISSGQIDSDAVHTDSHVALAAAALDQETPVLHQDSTDLPQDEPTPHGSPTELQCHKCHWKAEHKEPTPPPEDLPPREATPPVSSPIRSPPVLSMPFLPSTEPEPREPSPAHFWPPHPPNYVNSNGPYSNSSNWQRNSPTPPSAPMPSQMNGNRHSPQMMNLDPALTGSAPPRQAPLNLDPQLIGAAQPRQPSQSMQHSPIQNGRVPHSNYENRPYDNGYTRAQSPHRGMHTPPAPIHSGVYPSYATTRPQPQHLTNGGPPPRAPEQPFMRGSSGINPRPYISDQRRPSMTREGRPMSRDDQPIMNRDRPISRDSRDGPPMMSRDDSSRSSRDGPPLSREGLSRENQQLYDPANPQNGARSGDRINGGASASPSLRNLLS